MSKVVLCRICLRTDVELRDIPEELVELHDEFCEYEIYLSKMVKYCTICTHRLYKMYQFRQQCMLANKLFKEWQKKKNNVSPESLHDSLNPPSLGYSDGSSQQKIYNFLYDTDISDKQHILLYEKDIANITMKTEPVEELNIEYISHETEDLANSELRGDNIELQKDNFEIQIDNFELQNLKKENLAQEDNVSLSNSLDEPGYLDDLDSDYNLKSKVPTTSSNFTLKYQSEGAKIKSLNKVKNEKDDLFVKSVKKPTNTKNIVSVNNRFNKKKNFIKEKILDFLESGDFNNLGDNVKVTKEVFLKIFEKCDVYDFRKISITPEKELLVTLQKFIKYLMRKYNPEYEAVFEIEYLNTHEKKVQEFNRRKESLLYQEAPFKCELCYKGFASENFLNYHNRWHKMKPNDKMCNICPVRTSVAGLKKHHKENHTAVFSCRQCPFVAYRHVVMLNHYKQHKGVEYPCPTCLSVYNCQSTLNNHIRTVHAESHPCPSCARCFVSEKGLILHRSLKHSEATEVNPDEATLCTECDVTFDSHAIYLKHKKITHKQRSKPIYRCTYCYVRFDSIDELRVHKLDLNHQKASRRTQPRTFTDIWRKLEPKTQPAHKPFITCKVCQIEVPNTSKNCLYLHYRAEHPGVTYNSAYRGERHLCEECGKVFKVYQYYIDHKNLHTGAKPYECRKCPAKFATARNLAIHSERHGSPRHECNNCGKQFYSAANLFVHKRIHTGDRRFKCHICSKGFLHANALSAHVNGVHNHIRRQKNPKTRNTIKNNDN